MGLKLEKSSRNFLPKDFDKQLVGLRQGLSQVSFRKSISSQFVTLIYGFYEKIVDKA